MQISHRIQIEGPTFRALALRQSKHIFIATFLAIYCMGNKFSLQLSDKALRGQIARVHKMNHCEFGYFKILNYF